MQLSAPAACAAVAADRGYAVTDNGRRHSARHR